MLPFLIGLLGMFYQYRKGKTGKQDFWVVMLLFIMTGIAIIVFLNQTPMEPRERDYAYAGSFYAYAIWIGMPVITSIRVLRMQFYLLMEITILSHCGMYKKWKEYGGMSGSSI